MRNEGLGAELWGHTPEARVQYSRLEDFSPDGKQIYLSRRVEISSDIVLISNFR